MAKSPSHVLSEGEDSGYDGQGKGGNIALTRVLSEGEAGDVAVKEKSYSKFEVVLVLFKLRIT